jgi:predicted alpha-1,2-mannosidase
MKRNILLFIIAATIFSGCQKKQTASESLITYVKPIIGTSGHGHTIPGATVPFGRIQLSPDTHNEGWDWVNGYHYSDRSIIGFSHTHLSGGGRGDLLDVLFMPFTGETTFESGTRENPEKGFRSTFSHENETASAGYYKVLLDKYKITVELTATCRAGFHQYTFPENSEKKVIVDLFHSLKSDNVSYGNLRIVNDSLITGSRKSRGWGEKGEKDWVDHEVFFAARFSEKIKNVQFYVDGKVSEEKTEVKGKEVKVAITFGENENPVLLAKVGISEVDIDGALNNLDKEIPNWNFAKVKETAEQDWEKVLQSIKVKSDKPEKLETFYTAMYHTCVAPYTYSDVDKRYRGFDGKIHTAENVNYTALSLWDTFRALNPLHTIIQPGRVPDIIKSMLAQYDEYGLLPIWPLCHSETNCMIGYHSIPVIVDAYLKGIGGFDAEKAFEAMKKSAMQDDFDIKYLKEYNYIPRDLAPTLSVARTLEYAFDDWCIAQMALKMGKTEDYNYFSKRGNAFKNLFDTSIGFMRGKDSKGQFRTDFDPYNAVNANSDFIEGNSWQYTWFVPQDIQALINGMGGKTGFVAKLDTLFSVSSKLDKNTPIDVSGLIGQYAHGNEPSHHVAYLFNYGDAPWKTQERVHQIMSTLYSNKPDGLCGNEDMGQMSAWYVFSAIGFYPVNPVDGRYIFGTPQFAELDINLPNKKTFTVLAKNLTNENIYIEKVLLNGKESSKGYITHQQLLEGGRLEFQMSNKPGIVFTIE